MIRLHLVLTLFALILPPSLASESSDPCNLRRILQTSGFAPAEKSGDEALTLLDLEEDLQALQTLDYRQYPSSQAFSEAMKTKSDQFDQKFHARVRSVLEWLQQSKVPASEKARRWTDFAKQFHSLKRTWKMYPYTTPAGQHLYLGTRDYLLIIDREGTLFKLTADESLKRLLKRGITDAEVDALPKSRIEPKPQN